MKIAPVMRARAAIFRGAGRAHEALHWGQSRGCGGIWGKCGLTLHFARSALAASPQNGSFDGAKEIHPPVQHLPLQSVSPRPQALPPTSARETPHTARRRRAVEECT